MIFVNFKTYEQATGANAVFLAHTICDVAGESGVGVISCPQAVDLKEVVKTCHHPARPSKPRSAFVATSAKEARSRVWAQHVDPVKRGRATGWIPAEVAKEAGATGALLNHSEHKLSVGQLGEVLARCKEVGLETLVFAGSVEEAKVVSQFKPDLIGYEPPELIASKETSVARSKPDVIEKVVKLIADIPILIGAGVKDENDVRVGIERGAKGVVVSSAVVLTEDPKKVLLNLVEGFNIKK